MAWLTDSLSAAIGALNPFSGYGRQNVGAPGVFTHQLALAEYRSSGLLRKIIRLHADDRVREWRDWQAEKPQIEKIEAEEKRLGLLEKVRRCEVLRGIGGGALLIVTAGDHDKPLTPESIQPGAIVAINIVSRWQITGKDWITDLTSPDLGQPRMWEIASRGAGHTKIHPSRVICFQGDRLPEGSALSDEDAFWGDCRLSQVVPAVRRSDNAQGWFADLVRKAKLLRFGISNLVDYDQATLDKRVALIASGENSTNATIYSLPTKDGSGGESGGEKIDDYQVTWSGIPAMMDAFDQRAASEGMVPFTLLFGRSPAGMNATGEYDNTQWEKQVGMGQELELRPCLEKLDPLLLRSAGVTNPDKVWWIFAPLGKPSEADEAKTFDLIMTAIGKLIDSGTVPSVALAEAVQNLIEERGYLPGLAGALAKLPEDIRFGLTPEDDGTDPSEITQEGGDPTSQAAAGGGGSAPARRAANDAKPVPLYVQRKLLNASDLIVWAKKQGFTTTLDAADMHVTILYSRTPVDPIKMGTTWSDDAKGNLTIKPGGPRAVEKLGENAVVLLFASDDLSWRHRSMVENGASHDYEEYQPHVTLTYEAGDVDLDAIRPFTGELRFGPELFEPLDLDWKSKVTEA